MQDFEVYIPTRIFFGDEQGESFFQSADELGRSALIVIGGSSAKRLGYLEIVEKGLQRVGVATHLFEGVEPNPDAATVNAGAKEAKKMKADFIVALGGGSVIDAAKGMAALLGSKEKDVWPFVAGQPKAGQLKKAVPLVAIPTTAATASEVTPYAVISNRQTQGKAPLAHAFLKPRIAWLNPWFTLKLSRETTRDGAADILSHVLESYLVGGNGSPMADYYTEAVMMTVMETLPKVLKEPENKEARGTLLWASCLGLNGMQSAGREPAAFVLHAMEHALSGYYPALAHGRGLATLFPAYFRWLMAKNRGVDRLARMGRKIFGISEEYETDAAKACIEKFETWLQENELYQSLGDLGIDSADYLGMAQEAVRVSGQNGVLDALGDVTAEDIADIFEDTRRQKKSV